MTDSAVRFRTPSEPVSVIMPMRNAEAFVARALRSTLRALNAHSEVLILDDGSTDTSAEVVRSFNDRRVKLHVHAGEPLGVPSALNELLSHSKLALVARMDADDVVLPWRFHSSLKMLERFGGFTFAPAVYINRRSFPLRPSNLAPLDGRNLGSKLLLKNPLIHPTMVCEKEYLDRLDGYAVAGAEDYDLWLRAYGANIPLSRSSVPTILYRQHSAQVTGGFREKATKRDAWFKEDALKQAWKSAYAAHYGREFGFDGAETDSLVNYIEQYRNSMSTQ